MKLKDLFQIFLPFLIFHYNLVTSIYITHASVSSPAIVGERGILNCTWITQNSILYSLKWYQGLNEFYRWTPANEIQIQIFRVKGLSIDTSRTFGGYVEFTTTSIDAANNYRCEVSEDAPLFHTNATKVEMKVAALPDKTPHLTLDRISYEMYDNVTVGCNLPKAHPEPKLKFYLNNEAMDPHQVIQASYPDIETGLKSTEANVTFMLKPYMVPDGKLKIKCTAEIDEIYWDHSEIEVPGDHAQYIYHQASLTGGQSKLLINQLLLMIHLLLQASLFFINI